MPIGSNALITIDPATNGGASATTPDEIVKQKLAFFLQTNKGEIPNNPDYGANLIVFVDKPLDQGLVDAIDAVIRAELGMWFPYITVDGIEKTADSEKGLMAFTLYYEFDGNDQAINFNV